MIGADRNLVLSDWNSVLFDAARIFATFAVFIQHCTGDPALAEEKISLLGRAVIPLFLIVSGYMTAMTLRPKGSFGEQVLTRYLKYYYIVVPAILLTFLADLLLIWQNSPLVMHEKFDPDHGVKTFLREAFEAVTYSGEYWRITPVSQGLFGNAAFWTMDYILAYVSATIALYRLQGLKRTTTLCAITAIAGPTVLLLAPLWFLGVGAYHLHVSRPPCLSWACTQRVATWLLAAGIASVVFVEISGAGNNIYDNFKGLVPHEIRSHLGMAKRFPWQWISGLGLFLAVWASRYALSNSQCRPLRANLRKVAQFTLPVYMLHYPLIYVTHSLFTSYDIAWASLDIYQLILGAGAITLGLSWIGIQFLKPRADALTREILQGTRHDA